MEHWSTYVGQGAIRFYLPLNVQLPNPFFASCWSSKDLPQRDRVRPGWRPAGRTISGAPSDGSTRSNSAPRSAGRCNTG